MTMQKRGLPLAYVVTAGNQAQTGFAEIGEALLADPRVTTLGLHIEGIGDLRAFEALAATARKLGKPIVALKVGRSDQAQAATVSHTASVAGSDSGSRALFSRLGIGQVDTISDFMETLKFFHVIGPLASDRIASMSCSGGEASLMADLTLDSGLTYPPLNETQRVGLRAALGPMVKLANPLDYNTYIWPRTDAMAATFTSMMDPSLALGIVVLDFPRTDRCNASDWDNVIEAVVQTRDASGVPMAIVASLPENMPEEIALRLTGRGVAPMCGMAEALTAASVAAELGREMLAALPVLLPRPPRDVRLLTEAVAKAELARQGMAVPKNARAGSPADAAKAADSIGFPVVVKGEGVAHKTEAGAVLLNLGTAGAVLQAADGMAAQNFLIEEFVTGTVAELLVGVVLDPAQGYVLTLGAGGVLTELIADTVSVLIPASPEDIETALRRLRLFPVIAGYRGKAGADIAAIVRAVMAVQAYVEANHGRVEEVEINPLLCGPERAVAADALIRIGVADD
jgi:acyl-CoA synthetase (NDP forming)